MTRKARVKAPAEAEPEKAKTTERKVERDPSQRTGKRAAKAAKGPSLASRAGTEMLETRKFAKCISKGNARPARIARESITLHAVSFSVVSARKGRIVCSRTTSQTPQRQKGATMREVMHRVTRSPTARTDAVEEAKIGVASAARLQVLQRFAFLAPG